jgi:hypothetical protein
MGFDVGEWTPRILEGGLRPLPERLEPSRTFAIALWRGPHYGAVVFIRLWRDGETIDYDCAIAERLGDGSWNEPDSWSGAPWMPDPLTRPADGWDGDQVVWLGQTAKLAPLEDDDDWTPPPGSLEETFTFELPAGATEAEHEALIAEMEARMTPDPDEYVVRAVLGAASQRVAAIGVEFGDRSWTVAIESPCGAFIVGIEGPGVATLQPLDSDGSPVGPSRQA